MKADYLIVGAGVIGLSLASEIKRNRPSAEIIVLEKEDRPAQHSSGRNSGVLHAGFYYTENSLKARFTKDGNLFWREYCKENGLRIRETKKLVVCADASDLTSLETLRQRGVKNQIPLEVLDEKLVREIDPNVRTFEKALFSPLTANIDPTEICEHLREKLEKSGVVFFFSEGFLKKTGPHTVITTKNQTVSFERLINCAGLYADRIAHADEIASEYTLLPFKGLYMVGEKTMAPPVSINVYPVPNINNPFLGVHFTLTVDGKVKLGPTATPALWREQYHGFDNFDLSEVAEIAQISSSLLIRDSFGFRKLALEEIKKYNRSYFLQKAAKLVHNFNPEQFRQWSRPGIRAQLFNKKTRKLEQDFLVLAKENSVHVLNAVSPAFTSAPAFTKWIAREFDLV